MELQTDTGVVAYLFDLLVRRHNLPIELAVKVLASPFCEDIDRMPDRERRIATALRQVYGGVKYILIERAPYIGGQMIGRSKTFPTLDCSQCIFM